MKTQPIFRFAVLCALLGASAASTASAFAQKDDRNSGRSGTAKEDRNRRDEGSNKNKEGRGSSGTNKSDGRNEGASKGRKDRR